MRWQCRATVQIASTDVANAASLVGSPGEDWSPQRTAVVQRYWRSTSVKAVESLVPGTLCTSMRESNQSKKEEFSHHNGNFEERISA